MSTIEKSVYNLLEAGLLKKDITILWHAGEPLVMPISFYTEAINTIRKIIPAEIKIIHSFQTNGLLINEDWCNFFIEQNIELGISIDGFEEIHDLNRRTWNGKGTFKLVYNSIQLLKKKNIRLNIIAVVTNNSLYVAEEIYNFFLSMGVNSLSFNVEEIEGSNKTSSFDLSKDIKSEVKAFFLRIYKLHINHDEPFKIREINWAKDKVLNSDLSPTGLISTQLTGIYRTITIDCDGNFSTFSPELIANKNDLYGDLILGNVWDTSFSKALESDKFKKIHLDLILGLQKCKSECSYYGLCSGGTPSNKISEHGTLNVSETQHCMLTFQVPIDMILEAAQEENR